MTRPRPSLPLGGLLAALLAAALLAGCSGAAEETAAGGGGGGYGQGQPSGSGAEADGSADAAGGGSDGGSDGGGGDVAGGAGGGAGGGGEALARVVPADRSLVRTARLTLRVEDLDTAARRAGEVAVGAGGAVYAESTSLPAAGGAGQASLTLKVPPARLDAAVRELARLGDVLDRGLTTEDVTEEVTDVESRLRTQTASVARVRALLAQARTVGEVVAVEAELAGREADLESLQARSRALGGQVALSTVELLLLGPGADAPVGSDERGFLVGLERGWDAFRASVAVALTVLGALLPFLVVAGLVAAVALPLRARRRRAAVAPAA